MTGEAEESSYFISEQPKPWQWNTNMGILSGCDWFVVSSYNEKSLKCSDGYLIFFFFSVLMEPLLPVGTNENGPFCFSSICPVEII